MWVGSANSAQSRAAVVATGPGDHTMELDVAHDLMLVWSPRFQRWANAVQRAADHAGPIRVAGTGAVRASATGATPGRLPILRARTRALVVRADMAGVSSLVGSLSLEEISASVDETGPADMVASSSSDGSLWHQKQLGRVRLTGLALDVRTVRSHTGRPLEGEVEGDDRGEQWQLRPITVDLQAEVVHRNMEASPTGEESALPSTAHVTVDIRPAVHVRAGPPVWALWRRLQDALPRLKAFTAHGALAVHAEPPPWLDASTTAANTSAALSGPLWTSEDDLQARTWRVRRVMPAAHAPWPTGFVAHRGSIADAAHDLVLDMEQVRPGETGKGARWVRVACRSRLWVPRQLMCPPGRGPTTPRAQACRTSSAGGIPLHAS